MSAGMFVMQDGGGLVAMTEGPCESEDSLQTLLAEYPDLLAGDQIDRSAPRRWLLVCREAGIADMPGGPDRWSLDHLFLDQDAIPTLVEVKRSNDTRIRREVVGQMLDYAAHLSSHATADTMRQAFEAACTAAGRDPEQALAEFAGPEADVDAFWGRAQDNLRAGRVRLVFVADRIPRELQRVVEFLNRQMNPAEVLAVEIRQYVGQGVRTLVPRVIGQLAEGEDRRSSARRSAPWDEERVVTAIEERFGPEAVHTAQRILAWARERGLAFEYGRGATHGNIALRVEAGSRPATLLNVNTDGGVYVQFDQWARSAPFREHPPRAAVLHELNVALRLHIPERQADTYPAIRYSSLASDAAADALLQIMDSVVEQMRAASPNG